MILKNSSVKIHGIRPELVLALNVCDYVYREIGFKELVITSINDGEHDDVSSHYRGEAADLRNYYFSKHRNQEICNEIKKRLGIDFDIIIESDHNHLQYKPKRRYDSTTT